MQTIPEEEEVEEVDPLLGAVLADTYRLDALLAEGGMSRLYRGYHLRLEQPVAVKVSTASRSGRSSSAERAAREARILAGIRSDHVVRVLDLCETPDRRPVMVTELLEGMDLAQRIAESKRLSLDAAIHIGIGICSGVALAHARGLVHRDLKPSNIFLARDGEDEVVKVIDFGVAKQEGAATLTQDGAFLGTPSFMAPEQASRPSDVDARADIYAVGAILYNMVAGVMPYGTHEPHKTLMLLMTEPPPALDSVAKDIPPAFVEVVEAAMARAPEDRVATAAELGRRLEQLRGAIGTAPGVRWARLRALITALVAAVAAGTWAAALAWVVTAGWSDVTEWSGTGQLAFRAIGPAVALFASGLFFRSVARAWSSRSRLLQTTTRLTRSLAVGLSVYAIASVAGIAAHGWILDAAELFPFEHLSSLLLGATATLIYTLRRRRT